MNKNTLKYYIISLIMCFSVIGNSQNLEWIKTSGGNGYESGNSIVVDDLGNSYITGYFEGTVDFDNDTSEFFVTAVDEADIFILKLDPAGDFLWVKTIGGTNADYGYSIDLDSLNNIYVTGFFSGITDFDPGINIYNLNGGLLSAFLLKLNNQGNFIWAHGFSANNSTRGQSVKIHQNFVYLVGYGSGLNFDADPGLNNFILTNSGGNDIFVIKLDLNGIFNWAFTLEGTGDDEARSINVDLSNNILITGTFKETIDLDPGIGVYNVSAALPSSNRDIFILKVNSNGDFIFGASLSGSDFDIPNKIICDTENNVYVAGSFKGVIDFDPGIGVDNYTAPGSGSYSDGFILKLDSLGNYLGVNIISGVQGDEVTDLFIDANNNLYALGYFSDQVDLINFSSSYQLTTNGEWDTFILKSDTNGVIDWAVSYGGGQYDSGWGFSVSSSGSIYVTGRFESNADFDPDSMNSVIMNSNGNSDIFVQKLSQCSVQNSFSSITNCDSISINGQTYFQSGIYHQLLNSISACDSIITLNLTVYNVDSSVAQNSLTLTATSSGATYQWLDCNNGFSTIVSATNQSFTPAVNGSYAVSVTENGCTDTSACFTFNTIGVSENSFGENIKIYPNPSNGKLFIDLGVNKGKVNVSVKNAIGQIVYSESYHNKNILELNLNVEHGIYFVELMSEEGSKKVFKLIID